MLQAYAILCCYEAVLGVDHHELETSPTDQPSEGKTEVKSLNESSREHRFDSSESGAHKQISSLHQR
jgi:hypothetical protein